MRRSSRLSLLSLTSIVFAILLTGCQSTQPAGTTKSQSAGKQNATTAPLLRGMGDWQRRITTSNRQAQRYFNQGLVLTYAFNHDEAIRSYTEATRLDPTCAMAWWGVALCHGPHINNPVMPPERTAAALEALHKAKTLATNVTPVEKSLIDALGARYSTDPNLDRAALDHAYADAMRLVHKQYPDDPDVSVLCAESLMDLRPWDLWSHAGEPRPETPDVLALLESVLISHPNHPGANHLYIHATEASPHPDRAVAAADRLRTLVPGSGHLVHMPAHIDVRVGTWGSAAQQNRQAIKVDAAYRQVSPRQGFYNVYMAHNHHFLSWSCMMLGRQEEAIRAARDMIAGVPPEFIRDAPAFIDGYMPIAVEALMRFGRWDDILKEPAPPASLPITTAFWHFTRGVALAALNRVDEAVQEQQAFREAVAAVPPDAIMAINPAHKVLSIAEHVLNAEIAFRKGDIDAAVTDLTAAASTEDELMYMEPPDWVQPVRHTLGAVLVAAGRYEQARDVYEEDLTHWPENGWALFGLRQCLTALNDSGAQEAQQRFRKAWSQSDTQLASTCLCVKKHE